MAEPQLYWVVPCSRCSSPIALDVYGADDQLASVPEEFSAWCMICGGEEKCIKSTIEKRLLPAPALEFKPHSAFARRADPRPSAQRPKVKAKPARTGHGYGKNRGKSFGQTGSGSSRRKTRRKHGRERGSSK
jgi:hypothetical protein